MKVDYRANRYLLNALVAALHGVRCAIDFFGIEHILFGSDTPFDPVKGPGFIRATFAGLHAHRLDPAARTAIEEGNGCRLIRLVKRLSSSLERGRKRLSGTVNLERLRLFLGDRLHFGEVRG